MGGRRGRMRGRMRGEGGCEEREDARRERM